MLIIVLLLVWLAALAPIAYRRYVDGQASASVDRFSYRAWRARHANPAIGMTQSPAGPLARAERRSELQTQIRLERQRIRRRRERRRRVLVGLAGTISFSLVLGAIPTFRALWGLTALSSIVGFVYVYTLVGVARTESLNLERLRKIVPLGAASIGEVEHRGIAAADGVLYSTPLPRQPAFVVLEALSQ